MKRLITLMMLLSFIIGSTQARDRKHEFSVSAGALTTNDILDLYTSVLTTTFTMGYYKEENKDISAAYGASYKYYLTKRFSLGADFTYQSMTADAVSGDQQVGTTDKSFYTFAARADFNYVANPAFKLYSGIGIGFTQINQEYTPNSSGDTPNTINEGTINFQINALGIKVGRGFGAFLEGGFGYRGIVNVGLFAAF